MRIQPQSRNGFRRLPLMSYIGFLEKEKRLTSACGLNANKWTRSLGGRSLLRAGSGLELGHLVPVPDPEQDAPAFGPAHH